MRITPGFVGGALVVGAAIGGCAVGCSSSAPSRPPTTCTDTICSDAGGAPSDQYPAAHPPLPRIVSAGGPVLASPKIVPITYDGDPLRAQIESFVAALGTLDYFVKNASEYGVGPATSATPIHLTGAPPPTIDDAAVGAWLASMLDGTHPDFPVPDANTVFAIFYPEATTVTLGPASSCQTFGGYHSSAALPNKTQVAYAVIPRCANFGDLAGFDMVTGSASHELLEAATDPYPTTNPAFGNLDEDHAAWELTLSGGEIGDICAQDPTAFFREPHGYMVQRTWSNAAVSANQNPCIPTPAGDVYFNAAPVLDEPVTFTVDGQTLATKGVHLAAGQSKKIEVDFFSDGPMDAWRVEGLDMSELLGKHRQLDLTIDPPQAKNGQKATLTITVLEADPSGFETFVLVSGSSSTALHFWAGLVASP